MNGKGRVENMSEEIFENIIRHSAGSLQLKLQYTMGNPGRIKPATCETGGQRFNQYAVALGKKFRLVGLILPESRIFIAVLVAMNLQKVLFYL